MGLEQVVGLELLAVIMRLGDVVVIKALVLIPAQLVLMEVQVVGVLTEEDRRKRACAQADGAPMFQTPHA